MDTIEHQIQLMPSKIRNPRVFTMLGFLSGLVIWIVDAVIDVYIIEPDEALYESLFFQMVQSYGCGY